MKLFEKFKSTILLGGIVGMSFFMSCNSSETNKTNTTDSLNVATTDTAHSNMDANVKASHAEAVLAGTYPDTTLTGKAEFNVVDGQIKLVITLDVPAKANKTVAVHLHEHGDCGDMGMDSHGHWNPTNKQHGKWGAAEFHLGDIGNIALDASGKGMLEMQTNLWTIGGDSTTNIVGRAVIVHGGQDDFKTQPTGNAGNRIGCGVVQ